MSLAPALERCALLATLCVASASPPVHAQQIYKSVGPDGKVVFSDKPPTPGADNKVTIFGKPAVAAPLPASAVAAGAAPGASAPGGAALQPRGSAAKSALPPEKPVAQAAPSASAASPAIDPELPKTLAGVAGLEYLVRRTTHLCARALPTSFRKYDTAETAWKQRNFAPLAAYRQALAQTLSATQRGPFQAAVQELGDKQLAQVEAAPLAQRIKWCDQSSAAIESGEMDIARRTAWAAPLSGYMKK